MNLEILMATMFKKDITELDIEGKGITSDILIINQTDNSQSYISGNIRMLNFPERGSSNSRNRAIENAKGDICLVADDDIIFKPDYEKIIKDTFDKNPDADIITFQIESDDGTLFKKYLKKERWHNKLTVLKCNSNEIAFKRQSIENKNIRIDTEFGLGSKYRINDEIIFLMDCLNSGLKIMYYPKPIVIHPGKSSGSNYNEEMIFSKGAAFYRLFGPIGLFMNFLFAIKKYNQYSEKFTFRKFLKIIFSGRKEYINTHKT